MKFRLNLQMFAEGDGGAAPGAPAADPGAGGGAETAAAETQPGPISAGDTLPDGTKVADARVAAALEKQMRKHPELRNVYGKGQPVQQQPAQAEAPAEKTIEERWDEIRHGEFKELYGRDVQNAIQDRFRNQKATGQELEKLEPMLAALRDRYGVKSNDELAQTVLDDDSLYEEEADKLGMTVEGYRSFKQMEAENKRMRAAEEQAEQDRVFTAHLQKLAQQGEALKQIYPDFDLRKELANENFRRMTSPDVGISVEDAYYAIHHKELGPQMLAYGMQRAKQQMGQTLQAQQQRPAEGAMRTQGNPAAEVRLDPRSMTRKERAEIKRQVLLGRKVSFD